MSKERLYIFDTTLRDGAQTQGVHFSIDEKTKIAHALDNLGVDYIEGGWPGANPSDTEFFQKKLNLKNSNFTAFGMTKKTGRSAENDPGLSAILNSNTKSVCLVGKSWDFHVDVALEISNEENLENISETTKHFVKNNKEFIDNDAFSKINIQEDLINQDRRERESKIMSYFSTKKSTKTLPKKKSKKVTKS